MRAAGICCSKTDPAVQSATCPPVSRKAMGRQSRSVSAWILVVRPPRERPMPVFAPPFSARSRAVRLHGGGIDQHLGRRTAGAGQRVEEVDPDALGRPADIAVVERLARSVVYPYEGGRLED